MLFNQDIELQSIFIDNFAKQNSSLHVLRLDKIDEYISGNKWFKLQHYIADALQKNHKTIATFGGAFSNHIVATAAACKQQNIQSVGFIRGEEVSNLSHTLQQAKAFGMQLVFLNRTNYKERNIEDFQQQFPDYYFVDEGGFGKLGMYGIKEIYHQIPTNTTHIITACGTVTTLAGLTLQANTHQQIIGINVLKNCNQNIALQELLLNEKYGCSNYKIFDEYCFGGYAKKDATIFEFIKRLNVEYNLPTDFVYTAKVLFATFDLINKNYFPENSKIVVVHTGGLQGNKSVEEFIK